MKDREDGVQRRARDESRFVADQVKAMQTVLDAFPEFLYVSDPATYEVIFVNRTFREALGEDPVGKKCFRAFQGFDEPCGFCTNETILETRAPHVWEYHNPILDRTYRITDQIIVWPDGREVRFELAVDITDRKQQEHELRLKDIVFECASAANSTADTQGVINHVNPAFLELWGYDSKEKAIGQTVGDFFVNQEDAVPVLGALNETGQWAGEFLAKRQDGTQFVSRGWASVIRDVDGEMIGYYSANVDVTAQRKAEAELERTLEDLRRANAELEQFAYVASHDLQEPLRMVASYVQLIKQRYEGKLDPDADDFIEYAVDGANRMKRLINDLLTFSRVGTRGRPFETTRVSDVLRHVQDNLAMAIEEAGADIVVDPLPTIEADEAQLVQLFQNLLANAIKFRREGEHPRIRVSAAREGDDWIFRVEDNGIGIEDEYFDKIFIIFQRLHGKGDFPGTGIGLSVCKKIVERHGGRIWVESKPCEGSVFQFSLPTRRVRETGEQ